MGRQSYMTIALDVKNSTKRELVTKELKEIAKKLNSRLKNELINKECLIPFTIRRGDELIAIFSSFSRGYDAYFELYSLMNAVSENDLRFSAYIGIGLGFIDETDETNLDFINGSSINSAFRARDYYLKKSKSYSKQYNQYNKYISTFVYSLEDGTPYEVINHLLSYINENGEKRTDKQKEVVALIENNPEITNVEIADHIGITENGVYKIVQRSNYQLVKDAQFSLKKLLDFIQQNYREGEHHA
ncbi:winged helix-turn-helix domain-containing protein [Paenibacillus sp. 2TAB19]|uniref:winged helix-turn-helix domain-containing protein n=1 Tax=Paenibacillus sp. 2TAB19 TaxID=3233003 RepID=UPI003F9C6B6F